MWNDFLSCTTAAVNKKQKSDNRLLLLITFFSCHPCSSAFLLCNATSLSTFVPLHSISAPRLSDSAFSATYCLFTFLWEQITKQKLMLSAPWRPENVYSLCLSLLPALIHLWALCFASSISKMQHSIFRLTAILVSFIFTNNRRFFIFIHLPLFPPLVCCNSFLSPLSFNLISLFGNLPGSLISLSYQKC